MALIQPDGIIRILRDTGLNNTFQHTRYFSDRASQTSYFVGQTHITLDNQSYSRPDRGWIRIQRKADDLYNCDYLMFQNTAYGNKWFYAFITQIDYVSNNTSQVYFEIDPIQSWFFEYDLGRCLVERCHTASDAVGAHLEPEPIGFSDYVYNKQSSLIVDTSFKWVAYAPFDLNHPPDISTLGNQDPFHYKFQSGLMNSAGGLVQGLIGNVFTSHMDMSALFVDMDNRLAEQVKVIVAMPAGFIGESTGTLGVIQPNVKDEAAAGRPSTLNGYTPRNNKLLTAPYNTMLFTTGGVSGSRTLRYEYFTDPTNITFHLVLGISPNPELVAAPNNYGNFGGSSSGSNANWDESLTINDFPHVSWVGDAFAAYMGTAGIKGVINTVTSLGAALASGGMSGAGLAGFTGGLANMAVDATNAYMYQTASHGHTGGGGARVADGHLNFIIYQQCVNANDAKRIDDFFSVYGYAVNAMMQVPRHNRTHWTYVKTSNCTVRGNLPSGVAAQIASIHNNGITYWVNGTEIGNYNLSNNTL